MSYLRYLCLFTFSGVQHILCCVFVFVFLHLVYAMLPVSLDYPFLIAPSVFSNVYLKFFISEFTEPFDSNVRFFPGHYCLLISHFDFILCFFQVVTFYLTSLLII